MKKVLIIGGLLAGAYFVFGKKSETSNAQTPKNTPVAEPTFWEKYNGKIVIDNKGYWMLVLNGKAYTFADTAAIGDYTTKNPQHADAITVDFPAWEQYAVANYGGQYNPFIKA